MTVSAGPDRRRSAYLAGFVVGVAGGVATLEFPLVGWIVVTAFVVGSAVAHQLAPATGALLVGMGVAWTSLLIASGVVPDVLGWLLTGLGMFVVGFVVVAIDRRRRG